MHNMKITRLAQLKGAGMWEGLCPGERGVEEIAGNVHIAVSGLYTNNICLSSATEERGKSDHHVHQYRQHPHVVKNIF